MEASSKTEQIKPKVKRSTATAMLFGAIFGWLAHFTGLACNFILTPFLIEHLGSAGYGVWTLLATVTGYLGLADLGIGVAATKFLAQYVAKKDIESTAQVISGSFKTYLKLSFLIVLIALVVSLFTPYVGPGKTIDIPRRDLVVISVLLAGSIACQLLGTIFRAFLRAKKLFTATSVLGIFTQLATAIGIMILLYSEGAFVGMAQVVFLVAAIGLGLEAILAINAGFPWRELFSGRKSEKNGELFRLGFLVVATQVVRKVTKKVGTLGGVWVGGAELVAYISIAETFCEKGLAFTLPIRQMVLPTSSALTGQGGDHVNRNRFILMAPRIFLVMGLGMSVILFLYGEQFLKIWLKPIFASSTWPVLWVLAISLPFRSVGNCFELMLQGMGFAKTVTYFSLIEGLLLVLSAILLCFQMGGIGLAWAVVGTAILTGMLLPWQVALASNQSLAVYLAKIWGPAITVAGLALLAGVSMSFLGEVKTYAEIAGRSLVVGIVGGLGTFQLCCDQPLRRDVLESIRKKLLTRFSPKQTYAK